MASPGLSTHTLHRRLHLLLSPGLSGPSWVVWGMPCLKAGSVVRLREHPLPRLQLRTRRLGKVWSCRIWGMGWWVLC